MILSIIDSIYKYLQDVADDLNRFVTNNYDNPFFWISIVVVVLLVTSYAISKLANK